MTSFKLLPGNTGRDLKSKFYFYALSGLPVHFEYIDLNLNVRNQVIRELFF